jgi:hypothetical protein
MKRAPAEGLVIHTGRNATALTGSPRVAIVVAIRGQTILSRKLGNERPADRWIDLVVTVIGKQNRIETVEIVRRALVLPG